MRRHQEGPGSHRSKGGPSQGGVDWDVMVRSLTVIWALGSSFVLIVLLTTSPASGTRRVLWSIDSIGFAVLAVLLIGRDHLPTWTSDLCGALLTIMVGWAILTYGDPSSAYAFFYLWLSVHSFYFLPWRRAAPQLGLIAVDYAVTLAALDATFPYVRWLITIMTTVVISVGVALLRARVDVLVDRLGRMATTDPLTHLRNRRAFDEVFDLEVARADRSGQPVALVLADLDNFKSVNDCLGHPAGDDVLCRVARLLEDSERRVDMVMRLGGEEFALVLPDTDAGGAHLVAERMRLAVQLGFASDPVPITISFGIASYPRNAIDGPSLFAAADTSLLVAKRTGRNRCVISTAPATVTDPPADLTARGD